MSKYIRRKCPFKVLCIIALLISQLDFMSQNQPGLELLNQSGTGVDSGKYNLTEYKEIYIILVTFILSTVYLRLKG